MNLSKQRICAALLCLAAGNAAAQGGLVLQDPGQKTVRVVRTATAARHRRRLERCGLGGGSRRRRSAPSDAGRVRRAGRAHRGAHSLRRRCAVRRGAVVRQRPRAHHGAQHAPERQRRAGRPVLRHDRSFQRSAQRLLLRLESERRARRRALSQRLGVLRRLGFDLRRRRGPFRRRLDRRDRDPVQVDLVRSDDGHLGAQLLAHGRAQERDHRLGFAQPRLQPGRLGARGRVRGSRAGHRPRGRAVARRQRPQELPHRRVGVRRRAVARHGLPAHAAAQCVADDQHRFLGDGSRRSAGESHPARACSFRRSATSSCARPTSSSSAASAASVSRRSRGSTRSRKTAGRSFHGASA